MTSHEVGVGLVGSGFIGRIHAETFSKSAVASVRAVASRSPDRAAAFAAEWEIPAWHTDYRALVERPDVDLVCVAAPNWLHRDVVVAAADAGKHVVCEKPLARTLREADEMIAACRAAGVKLMYAEELCFAPKYVRAKELADEGALGDVFLVRQSEQHFGPHSDWFWDAELAGGGTLMDMGCHGIEFARWVHGKPPARSVSAEVGTFVHRERTRSEDHAIVTIQFEGQRIGLIEASWAKPGGVDDRAEIVGSMGVTYADLLRGSSLTTYSDVGYGYAVEKAPDTRGWTFTMFDELWNSGFPQEMDHFARCVADDVVPRETGEDGRAVLEIIYAAYRAARLGRVEVPLQLTDDEAARPPFAQLDERQNGDRALRRRAAGAAIRAAVAKWRGWADGEPDS
jgi:myo-inositol 2-dehydrogenase/D-chiro-inositol 1-dehydrogenase